MKKILLMMVILALVCMAFCTGIAENTENATPTDLIPEEDREAETAGEEDVPVVSEEEENRKAETASEEVLPVVPEEKKEESRSAGTFTVTFFLNNGTGDSFQLQVPEGDPIEAPEDTPIWEGHVFEGWYNDPVVGRAFTFGEPVYGDRTLYAHWSLNGWKISQWTKQLIRGGSNISYDESSRTLSFGAGELILTRHDGSRINGVPLAAGYYMGVRIEAPAGMTDLGEIYRIEIDGVWYDFNGEEGILDGVSSSGCLYTDVYEPIDLEEIRSLCDRNAKNYKQTPTPGNRDLVIEDPNDTGGGRRGRGDGESGEEVAFVPELKTWTYRIARAGQEGGDQVITLTVTLDPRFIQFRDGNDLAFSVQGYLYRYRVKFDLAGGNGEGNYDSQIVFFGEKASEPIPPVRDGYIFGGWYTFWKDGDEVFYNDWAYDFADRMGIRSSFTLRAKWNPVTFQTTLNLADYTGIFVYIHLPEGEDPALYFVHSKYKSYRQGFDRSVRLDSLKTYQRELDGKQVSFYRLDALHAASTEMSDRVTVTLEKDGMTVRSEEYSVRSIAEEKLAGGDIPAEHDTIYRALLQYGHYAQIVFDNKTDDLPDITGAPALVPIPDSYAPGGDPEGFTDYISGFEGKLDLKATLSMNLYLTLADGYGRDDFEYTVLDRNGNNYGSFSVKPYETNKIRVRIEGIRSPDMARSFQVKVTLKRNPVHTAAWTRSVIACACNTQKTISDENAKKLLEALYRYYLAVSAVFSVSS